jgi:hypothetical protein
MDAYVAAAAALTGEAGRDPASQPAWMVAMADSAGGALTALRSFAGSDRDVRLIEALVEPASLTGAKLGRGAVRTNPPLLPRGNDA